MRAPFVLGKNVLKLARNRGFMINSPTFPRRSPVLKCPPLAFIFLLTFSSLLAQEVDGISIIDDNEKSSTWKFSDKNGIELASGYVGRTHRKTEDGSDLVEWAMLRVKFQNTLSMNVAVKDGKMVGITTDIAANGQDKKGIFSPRMALLPMGDESLSIPMLIAFQFPSKEILVLCADRKDAQWRIVPSRNQQYLAHAMKFFVE